MRISFIRGAYLNNFEGQNYQLPNSKYKMTGYSSLMPIDSHVSFPVVKLPSLADIQIVPFLNKPIKYIANRTLGDSQLLWGLEKYISGSDIVHVGDPHYYYSYQAAMLKAKKQVKKLISTWWETIPFNNESTIAKKRIKKYTMNQVDMFLCYSEKARKCLLTEGVLSNKITVIPLGVDLTLFSPKINNESKNITILFVGRLVEEKGIMDVYEAFKRIAHSNKQTKLKIVGSGPLRDKLQSLIQKDGFQNKVTLEHKSYQEMPKVFNQADIFCVPSKKTVTWEEQYGMAFIEAMASGLPIVSYTTGAIPELVGGGGLLVQTGDTELLAQLLKRVCSDIQLRSKIGTIGRERAVKLFDAKKTAYAIEKLYTQIIHE